MKHEMQAEKAIEINPTRAEAWHNKGHANFKTGNFGAAIVAIDKTIELNPHIIETWYLKSELMASIGQKEKENEALKKAKELERRR